MDFEQLIFVVLIIAFSIFSMYLKSKRQKRSAAGKEESDSDLLQYSDSGITFEPVEFFEPKDAGNLPQNVNIFTNTNKKKQKKQNLTNINSTINHVQHLPQNIDLENEIELLEDFEGSEVQKAFLYSEIFKNANN